MTINKHNQNKNKHKHKRHDKNQLAHQLNFSNTKTNKNTQNKEKKIRHRPQQSTPATQARRPPSQTRTAHAIHQWPNQQHRSNQSAQHPKHDHAQSHQDHQHTLTRSHSLVNTKDTIQSSQEPRITAPQQHPPLRRTIPFPRVTRHNAIATQASITRSFSSLCS